MASPHHGCVVKLGSPPLMPRLAQVAGASDILQEADECATECGRVARRDQEPLLSVGNLVGNTTHSASNDGDTDRHGL